MFLTIQCKCIAFRRQIKLRNPKVRRSGLLFCLNVNPDPIWIGQIQPGESHLYILLGRRKRIAACHSMSQVPGRLLRNNVYALCVTSSALMMGLPCKPVLFRAVMKCGPTRCTAVAAKDYFLFPFLRKGTFRIYWSLICATDLSSPSHSPTT